MTIPLTGAQSLFVRWGHIAGGLNEHNTARGATLNTRVETDIFGDFTTDQVHVVEDLFTNRDAARAAGDGWATSLRQLFQTTLIEMADDDVGGLNPKSLNTALNELISQMTANSESINRPGVTASVAVGGSNVGDGVCVVSVTDNDGAPADYVFAEDIIVKCTSSSQSGGAAAGQESFSVVGQAAVTELHPDWPAGSGVNTTIQATDASATTLVQQGDFEGTWLDPDNDTPPSPWAIVVGTAGTHIARQATAFDGDYAMEYVGDGSTLTSVRQLITQSLLAVKTTYAFNVWLRKAGTLSAGVLRIRLADGSGTTINDDAGTANSVSVTLSSLTTSYAATGVFFRTPSVLPTQVYLYLELTTAIDSGGSLYIDDAAMVAAQRIYPGGPFVRVFSGEAEFAVNDVFTITIGNSGDVNDFTRTCDRFLGLRTLGKKIPSSGSATINDNLIT